MNNLTPIRSPGELVLASGSPRRLTLLEQIGFEPEVSVSDIPEKLESGETALDYTQRLAFEKASDVSRRFENRWLIAADTVVVFDGEILEKPADDAAAFEMLDGLSGRKHTVVTSYCCYHSSGSVESTETDRTEVYLRKLSDETIECYIETGEPFDKSGGYGIQDIGGAFVESVTGSYFTVVGLPVSKVIETFLEIGALKDFPFSDG